MAFLGDIIRETQDTTPDPKSFLQGVLEEGASDEADQADRPVSPTFLERVTRAREAVDPTQIIPLLRAPRETLTRAKEAALQVPAEAERLKGVFKPALGPLSETAGVLLSSIRGLLGIPFEALAPKGVSDVVQTGLEAVKEHGPDFLERTIQAVPGGSEFKLSPEARAITGEILPDIAAIGVPVIGKSVFKAAKAARTPRQVAEAARDVTPEVVDVTPKVKSQQQFIKDALAEAEKAPEGGPRITTEPGKKGVSAEQGTESRLGQEQVLFRDGEKPLIITEGSVDVSTKIVNGKKVKQALVKFDKLGEKPPEVLSTEGLTFESAKGRYAKDITDFDQRFKGLTPLEKSIGERASSKQTENFPDQWRDQSLSRDQGQKMNALATGFLLKNKIATDPKVPITLTIVNTLSENPQLVRPFLADLKKFGISEEQFFKAYKSSKSQAAKQLADQSVAERRLRQAGLRNPEIKKVADAVTKEPVTPTWGENAHKFMTDWIDIFRGQLVTQFRTLSRNFQVQGVVISLDAIELRVGQVMQNFFRVKQGLDPIKSLMPVWDVYRTMFNKGRKQQVLDILDAHPKAGEALFRRFLSDVELGTIGDPTVKGVIKSFPGEFRRAEGFTAKAKVVTQMQNIGNLAQEFFWRKTAFWDDLARRLEQKGVNLEKIKGVDINPLDVLASVEHSLTMTFANAPKGWLGKGIMKVMDAVPPLKLFAPFMRFMINSNRYIYIERSPLKLLKLLSKKERAALATGGIDAQRSMGRAVMGASMLVTAYALRKLNPDGEWFRPFSVFDFRQDLRPFNPFASYMFIADLIVRIENGTLDTLDGRELFKGLFSSNVRAGTGQFLLDNVGDLVANFLAMKDPGAAWDAAKRMAGETAGAMFTQLGIIRDIVADERVMNIVGASEFAKREALGREKREHPFLGPIAEKIPGVSQLLPERKFPLGTGDTRRVEPLLSQITGQIFRKDTATQLEASKLQLTLRDLQPTTGIPKLNRLTAEHARPRIERQLPRIMALQSYKKLSFAEKRVRFRKAVRNIISASRNTVLARRENRDLRKEFREKRLGRENVAARKARRERLGLPPR